MTHRIKPVVTVRDGAIKISGWRNESGREDGRPFYSFRITRTYKDKSGQWQDSDRFTAGELLRAQHLIGKAYDQAVKLMADDRADGEDIDVVRDAYLPNDPDETPF